MRLPCHPSLLRASTLSRMGWRDSVSSPSLMPDCPSLPQYSAAHGLEWWQVDFSYYIIRAMELTGLAWEVKRPGEAQKTKLRLKP